MKHTQKLLMLFLIALCVSFSMRGQLTISPITQSDGIITVKEFQHSKLNKLPTNPVAIKAIQKGEKRGEFKNVTYTLSPKVKQLTQIEKNQLNISEDGILKVNKSANKFVPSPDFIYIDEQSDLVFKTTEAIENQALMFRPKMHEVFENIEIPEQEVEMTLANTTEVANGAVITSTGDENNYAVNMKFDSITYTIDSLKVTLIGEVTLTQPRVEGRYSKNNGYNLVFKTSERVDLRVRSAVKFSKEKKILLWGTEIPVKKIGKCELGVYAVISIEGEVTLVVDVHQGVDVALGAKGGTFYYIPTSIHNASSFDQFCEVDYELKAKMKAFAGVQCSAKLKFKSYDVLDVYVKGGMEGTVESDAKTLTADVGVRFKAGGKIVSKSFTIVDKYFSLWKLQKPDMNGYKMDLYEVCAFGDYVAGKIQKTEDGENFSPHKGNLKIMVKHTNGTQNEFDGISGDDGIFIAKNIPLKKGDKVAIKLPNVSNLSSFMDATIPFKEIKLNAVDYFTGAAYGNISASKSDWYKLATQTQASQNQSSASQAIKNTLANKNIQQTANIVKLSNNEFIKRISDFKNNILAYNGEVKFITQNTTNLALTGNSTSDKSKKTTSSVEKPKENKGFTNNQMGFFEIKNLEFNPNQKIKAQINVEGFTVESDWIETDGLLVSEIESEGIHVSKELKSETISSNNSFVVISAVRGDKTPTGNVSLLSGINVSHASITNSQVVSEFPEAKKAIVFIQKTVTLSPLAEHEGAAIAQTGNWSSTINYMNAGDILLPSKNGKHPFEKVVYVFKENDLGHQYLIDECHSCNTPENVVTTMDNLQNLRKTDKLGNVGKKLQKQTQKVIPKVGGGMMQNM